MQPLNKYLLLIFLVFTARSGHAQVLAGIKQGVNISSLFIPPFDPFPAKIVAVTRYSGGVVFQCFTEKYLGLQAELIFSQKGFKTSYDTLTNKQYERKIDYISLPFMTHFYFMKKKASPFLLFGAFGGVALKSDETFRDGSIDDNRDYNFRSERDNEWEFGLMGGGGFKGNFSFGTIQIEATYSHSLCSLYKWGYQHNDPALDSYFRIPQQALNTVIQVSLSYLLPLDKKSREN